MLYNLSDVVLPNYHELIGTYPTRSAPQTSISLLAASKPNLILFSTLPPHLSVLVLLISDKNCSIK